MASPTITFSIRNNAKSVNYVIEPKGFATLPEDIGVEIDIPPQFRPKVAKATITLNGVKTPDDSRAWRIPKVTLWKINILSAVMVDVTGKEIASGSVTFNVNDRKVKPANQPNPDPKPADGIVIAREGKGICMYASDDAAKCIPILKDLGIDRIRTWVQPSDYGWTPNKNWIDDHARYLAAGFKVMPTVTLPKVPDSRSQAQEFWRRVAGAFAGKVTKIHTHNEANLPKYFPGTMRQAFDLIAVPANIELGRAGITHVFPSISEHPENFEVFWNLGLKDLPGQVAIDPYGADADDQRKNRIDPVVKIVNGTKAIICPEFNLHSAREAGWAVEFPKAYAYASQFCKELYYYRLFTNKQYAGMRGVMEKDTYAKNQPEYDIVKGLK